MNKVIKQFVDAFQWPYLPWTLYLAISPLYIFPSGYPQPADIGLSLGALFFLAATKGRLDGNIIRPISVYFAFFVYGLVVSIFVVMSQSDWEPIFKQIYFFYTGITFTYTIILANRDPRNFFRSSFFGFLIALFVVGLAVASGIGERIRSTGTYNNPNQLGYFSLIAFVSLALISVYEKELRRSSFLLGLLFLLVGSFGVSLSTLVSGVAGIGFYSLYLLKNSSYSKVLFTVALLLLGASAYLTFSGQDKISDQLYSSQFGQSWESRLGKIDEKINELGVKRGYVRIMDNKEYWFFGAGRGSTDRFNSTLEIHSSIGSIFFSYGIIGLTLFLYLIFWFVKKSGLQVFMITAPIWIYSITHYGLNQPSFWAIFALLLAGCRQKSFLAGSVEVNETEENDAIYVRGG